jgi:hypothetical protein
MEDFMTPIARRARASGGFNGFVKFRNVRARQI